MRVYENINKNSRTKRDRKKKMKIMHALKKVIVYFAKT